METKLRESRARRRPFTVAIMANSVSNLLTAEPTPTPEAPTDIAIGIVTSESPEAQITGTSLSAYFKAVAIAKAPAKVGDAFSIKPKVPGLCG